MKLHLQDINHPGVAAGGLAEQFIIHKFIVDAYVRYLFTFWVGVDIWTSIGNVSKVFLRKNYRIILMYSPASSSNLLFFFHVEDAYWFTVMFYLACWEGNIPSRVVSLHHQTIIHPHTACFCFQLWADFLCVFFFFHNN